MLDLPMAPVWEIAVHLADIGMMVSFCVVLFPLDVLDEIWNLIESVSEGFLTYFTRRSNGLFSKYTKNENIFFWLKQLSSYIRIASKYYAACREKMLSIH